MVVNDIGQMVGRQLVGTLEEYFIIEDAAVYSFASPNFFGFAIKDYNA